MSEYTEAEDSVHLMRAAIDAAFCSEVDQCFAALVDGLAAGQEQAVGQFAASISVAEQAREVALGVVRGR